MSDSSASPSPSRLERQFERLPVVVYADSGEACRDLAAQVRDLILSRRAEGRRAVLGLATGSTPVPFYRELIRLHCEEGLSFRDVVTFNLDEYYGIGGSHPESYRRFMRDQLFDHVDIEPGNTHVPDGTAPMDQVFGACEGYEAAIAAAGGIDLQILGIGRTGHIGFNEPGSTRDSRTRMIALDRITRRDAAPDFLGEEHVPRFAITMGVGTILEAREVVLLAWGENKAQVVAQAAEGPQTEAISASFLQGHPRARFLIDRAAASELTRVKLPWLVGRVDWAEAEARRAVMWLAGKVGRPILKLVDDEYNEHGMGELLTREGTAYHLNIRIFNHLQHTITGWPGGKPEADDSCRPEKALPYPKRVLVVAPEPEDDVLAMGGTMERLVSQGHDVHVCYQTSGNLRVSDGAATKFARVLHGLAAAQAGDEGSGESAAWREQRDYARSMLESIEAKGAFGEDPPALRGLKSMIRRGEARDACSVLGVANDRIRFLDLPFYEQGRYRRFVVGEEDVARMFGLLAELRPHQIYATGHLADPSSVQALGFRVLMEALRRQEDAWAQTARLWLYRAHQRSLAPHEVAMAVPMSPDQLETKIAAIQRFQTHSSPENLDGQQNREMAVAYDDLGMAEYEAIETFERG